MKLKMIKMKGMNPVRTKHTKGKSQFRQVGPHKENSVKTRKNTMKTSTHMNIKTLCFCLFILLSGITAYSQCNQHLVEIAAANAGSDAIYIRDFKVKLSKGSMENPAPTGKFPVYLNKGASYRFTIANAEEFQGKAFVELTKKGQSYTGNYDFATSVYSSSFDFECMQSATYQMLINFGEGEEGCAAVVMSLILKDSMSYIEPGVPVRSDSNGVLYLWSDNTMQIASTEGRNASLHVSVSQGQLNKKGSQYIIRPDSLGTLTIHVKVMKDEKEIERDSLEYRVEYPPLPILMLPGENSGTLNLKYFNTLEDIRLEYPTDPAFDVYQLKSFSIASDRTGFGSVLSNEGHLSFQQVNYIKRMNQNDVFYIINATFIDPEGNEHIALTREIRIIE
jgi:hypothetical protein